MRPCPVAEPLELRGITLRNRLVATAHASGLVQDGLPVAGDDAYWGRLAAGGAAMLIGGGTVTAPECSPRRGNIQEAWRPEIVEPWRRRVRAIHDEGGVAVVQLVHLGRETLGAESYWSPVAPSAVRSPREPTAPRAMLEREVDAFVEGFRVSLRARAGGGLRRHRAARGARVPARAVPLAADEPARRRAGGSAAGDRGDSRAVGVGAARHPLQRRRVRGRRPCGRTSWPRCCRSWIRSSTGSTSRSASARPTCATWPPSDRRCSTTSRACGRS